MEQHPVPRDITGFQFKLVGTMTLKQFGYIVAGGLVGFVCFKAPLAIFRLPLTGLFWFLGFALAFIPIQERPLDRWLAAFIKSVYSPTQFLWRKTPPDLEVFAHPAAPIKKKKTLPVSQYVDSRKKLDKYLMGLPQPLEQQIDAKEGQILSQVLSIFGEPVLQKRPPAAASPPPPPQPSKEAPLPAEPPIEAPTAKPTPIIPPPLKVKKAEEKEEKKEELVDEGGALKEKKLQEKIEALRTELEQKEVSRERFLELSQQITQALEEKRRLEKEVGVLRKRVAEKKEEGVVPKEILQEEKSRVKIITPQLAPKMGIPNIPQSPNIVSGLVKDPTGRLLPGIIITVKDERGETKRALKTNNVGLFVSATSLPSGIYTLEIEDPKKRFEFDIIKTTLQGEVYSPLEITAKGEREQLRESLTRELFGQT